MPSAARITDKILGRTDGEHAGHTNPHGPCTLEGIIITGSGNVIINGLGATRITDITQEWDCCCDGDTGVIIEGSGSVFINGLNASRVGDEVEPHNGTAFITTGSNNVFIGG